MAAAAPPVHPAGEQARAASPARADRHAVCARLNSPDDVVVSRVDPPGRCVARPAGPGESVDEILVFRPRGNHVHGFLLVAETEPRPIHVLSDPLVAPVLSFILDRTCAEGRVALRSPNAPRFVCATPRAAAPDADLNCNRDAAGGWELFSLRARDGSTIHPGAARLIGSIQTLFDRELTAGSFIAWATGQPADVVSACGLAIVRVMERDDQKLIAVRCLDDETFLERLIPAGSDDKWLTRMIPELRRWNVDRSGPSRLTLDQSWDYLGRDFGWQRVASIGEILHCLARETIEPRRGICVMTTARNEGIYFLEWMAHHRAIGVEHFLIYSNDNNDGSDALLARLADLGLITWISNTISKGVDLQTRAYTHCLTYLRQPLDFRWTILIDLDEFIILNQARHASLPDFLRLQASRGAEAVSMNWSMYTPSGQARWDTRPMLERFTFREPQENATVKTAFLTRLHVSSWPHNPAASYRRAPVYLNAAGRLHHGPGSTNPPHQGEPTFEDAWIGHYFFKSFDEYIWKTSRGFDLRRDLAFNLSVLGGFLRWFDPSSSTEDVRALPHLDALNKELAHLRSLPGLSEAESESRRAFVERVGAMKREVVRAIECDDRIDADTRRRWMDLIGADPVGDAT